MLAVAIQTLGTIDQAQWWPHVAGASADLLLEQSLALVPQTKTFKNMIVMITPPPMYTGFGNFKRKMLTAVSGLVHAI